MRALLTLLAAGLLAVGCGSSSTEDAEAPDLGADNDCVVWLHGKGGEGAPATRVGDQVFVYPEGNGEAWGGHEWAYADPDDLVAAVLVVEAAAIDAGCQRVVVDGFSNGGAMAAKLYCEGITLDGALVGVVIDDPVTDASADFCDPAAGVEVALYWTGKLPEWGPPGVDCDGDIDWTCEGGTVMSIDEYADRLGVDWQESIHTDHEWYLDAPEIAAWLG